MKRDSSKLFIMAGSLLGVVLLTAAVIYSYAGAPGFRPPPRRSSASC